MAKDIINALNFDGNTHVFTLPYGVCDTAADTQIKVVTVDNFPTVDEDHPLEAGTTVIVKFINDSNIASPKLNVNGTGDIPIYRYATTGASTGDSTTGWRANSIHLFTYDGAGWMRTFWENTTYSNVALGHGYASCTTAAGTVAKTVSLSSYALTTGGRVSIRFTNGITVANPTLNINSKGAKAIYFNGAALTDTTLIQAGDTVTFVYSSQYHIVAINGSVCAAGSYGIDENKTPSFGGSFNTPYITVDQIGRVVNIENKTVTIPNTSAGTDLGLIKSGGIATITSGQITNISEADTLNSISLGTNGETVDLNTLYEYGKYKVYNLSSSGTYTNLPSGVTSGSSRIAVFTYPIASSSFGQELYVNNNKKYIRYSNGTSTWYDWNVLVGMKPGTAIGNSTNKAIYLDANGTPTAFQITPANIGAAPTSHASTGTSYGKGTNSNYGHVKLSDAIDGTAAAASGGTAATPAAVKAAYDASAKVASPNTFTADNTFDENTTTTLDGAIVLGANSYGSTLPEVNNSQGRIFFVEDTTQDVLGLPAGGNVGEYLIKAGTNDGSATWAEFSLPTEYNEDGVKSYLLAKHHDANPTIVNYDTNIYSMGGYLYAPKVYGAVWNDYAEYRNQTNIIEPGYCVASKDSGEIYKTTEKFQACDGIVSDTFGFAIGETEKCKTPLAVAGRVLAYCEGNREDYHAGDTVCAGPEGKVCKMTREEIREWPDRIVGIVSEIPEYDTWGSGNVKVNNRIWIKVK